MTGRFAVDSAKALTASDLSWYQTGTLEGKSSKGNIFSATIRDSVVSTLSCPWIRSGIIDLTVAGADITNGTIDYIDDGNCNEQTIYNFGGTEYHNKGLKRYM